MNFDKFWEDVIRWFPEETSEELEDKRELLKAAYSAGLAEGALSERDRQIELQSTIFEKGYEEAEKDLSERFNLK